MKILFASFLLLAGCASNSEIGTRSAEPSAPVPASASVAPSIMSMVSHAQPLTAVQLPPLIGTADVFWNASDDTDVVSYNLYYGPQSQGYLNEISTATNFAKVTGLTFGAEYFFAVTAVNGAGLESDFSGELAYLVPTPSGWIVLRFNFPAPVASLANIYIEAASDLAAPWATCAQCYPLATNAANSEMDWLAPFDPGLPQQFFKAVSQGIPQ